MYKRFPRENYYGLEISEEQKLVEVIKARNNKTRKSRLLTIDAFEYDYSHFGIDDLIFVSV